MKMKRLLPFFALAVLAGCSSSSEKAPAGTTPEAKGSDALKVALITPSPVNDAGWSAMAYEGLKGIETDMGAQIDNQVATDPGQIKDAMRTYAQKGYALVFGHGYEYNEPGVEVSKDFPETVFISSSGGKTAANAGAFRFYLEEGCYLAGMLAAKMSKTGVVGSVATIDVPSINSTLHAFEAGAKAARPDIKIIPIVYLGSGFENDVAKAKQATESVIGQGADFVIHQANAAAQGVFDAAKEKGIYAFGTNADQNENPSGAVLGSAVIIAKPAFVALAEKVKAKSYKGEVSPFGLKDGAIDFVINPKLADKISADVKAMIEKAKEDIKSGKLNVPKAEF